MHCPPAGGALAAPLRAVAVFAVLAVCAWAADALVSLWAAVLAVEAVLAVAGAWAVQRRVRYWGWRKPRPVERAANRVTVHAELVRAPYELPAPPLAIAAPAAVKAAQSVLSPAPGYCSYTAHHAARVPVVAAVVPGARDGAKVER